MAIRVFFSLLGTIISLISLEILFTFPFRDYVNKSYEPYISLFIVLGIGVFLFINSKNFSKSLSLYSFLGGILIGGIGGALGMIGPIIFSDSNLGPLLGIFFTGPLGFLIGLIGGGIYWKIKVENNN